MVQLRIQYNQVADGLVEYTLRTTIEQTTSTPNALDKCLVVQKGDSGANEVIMRVGTYAEVVASPLNDLPATVNLFYSPSLSSIAGGIQQDDIIKVDPVPFLWAQHFGTVAPFQTVVDDHLFATNTVSVVTPFPAFARNLRFQVLRGASILLPVPLIPPAITPDDPVDGVANRDYTAWPGATQFLASDHADTWNDIDEAEGRYQQLRMTAQSLVDEMKQDNYTGQADEVYE